MHESIVEQVLVDTQVLKACADINTLLVDQPIWIKHSIFQEFLKDITNGISSVDSKQVVFPWYVNTGYAHVDTIWEGIGVNVCDLGTLEGCLEARIRLVYIIQKIQDQRGGKSDLLSTADLNFFGKFRLTSGDIVSIVVRLTDDPRESDKPWAFVGWHSHMRHSGNLFLGLEEFEYRTN